MFVCCRIWSALLQFQTFPQGGTQSWVMLNTREHRNLPCKDQTHLMFFTEWVVWAPRSRTLALNNTSCTIADPVMTWGRNAFWVCKSSRHGSQAYLWNPNTNFSANVATDVQQTDVHIIELKELYLAPTPPLKLQNPFFPSHAGPWECFNIHPPLLCGLSKSTK